MEYHHFVESLKTYKYRDDVVLTGYLEEQELARVTGAAYGMIYPSLWEGFGVPVLEAMSCQVPVITSAGSAMEEVAGDAALYSNPADYQDIAEKMMLLYKDENLRRRLIGLGMAACRRYSWDNAADLLWQAILKAMK